MARPRIRSLKPEIWEHEKFGKITPEQRLLFLGLITMADDEGRLRELPTAIIGHVFPYDRVTPKKLGQWLHRLAQVGLLDRYSVVPGEKIIQLHGWHRHQKINRANRSELPAADTLFTESDHDSRSESAHDKRHERVHDSPRAGRREGKGRDQKGYSKGGGRTDESGNDKPPPVQGKTSSDRAGNPTAEVAP